MDFVKDLVGGLRKEIRPLDIWVEGERGDLGHITCESKVKQEIKERD